MAQKRVIIAGLPRCGSTLLATFLNAQDECTFITSYLTAFRALLISLDVDWDEELNPAQRRTALLMVREQLLLLRHPVLMKVDDFRSLDQLHRGVLSGFAPGTPVAGHKLRLPVDSLDRILRQSDVELVVLFRDPRDAALSYWHRTGHGVESYLLDYREMIRYLRSNSGHPRLTSVRYETMVTDPAAALTGLEDKLGLHFDFERELSWLEDARNRSRWQPNTPWDDVGNTFDRSPIGRWHQHRKSPLVRYTNFFCQREIKQLGYEPWATRREARFVGRVATMQIERALARSTEWLSDRILRKVSGPIRHID